jgi:hypothetical protein
MKPSGNSDLRIVRKDKGSFPSIEISNHFTSREHWPAIISRWYKCSLHLYDIPTSHGVSNATDGDESVELNLTIYKFWSFPPFVKFIC